MVDKKNAQPRVGDIVKIWSPSLSCTPLIKFDAYDSLINLMSISDESVSLMGLERTCAMIVNVGYSYDTLDGFNDYDNYNKSLLIKSITICSVMTYDGSIIMASTDNMEII